jgi:dipeptidase
MRGDMVVALPQATAQGHTLFGHNLHHTPARDVEGGCREVPGPPHFERGRGWEGTSPPFRLIHEPGRSFPPGESVQTSTLNLPQVRQTFAVWGGRFRETWGYAHGVNERGLAIGNTPVRTRLGQEGPALDGSDLTRLALERAECARHAVEVLTDLIGKHGQGRQETGTAFLIADGREAFVLEACGRYWALQTVGRVRAVSDFCYLHQDWDRIARGLADEAIARGWWPGDGSKLNFTQAFGSAEDATAGLPRWGRATLLLEEHYGRADLAFFRHLLGDHGPPSGRAALCRHAGMPTASRPAEEAPVTEASLIAELPSTPEELPLVWLALGPPCLSVYLPVVLMGDLPRALCDEGPGGIAARLSLLREEAPPQRLRPLFSRLNERLDQDSREFLAEAKHLALAGSREELHALAGSFMQHAVDHFEDLCAARQEALT